MKTGCFHWVYWSLHCSPVATRVYRALSSTKRTTNSATQKSKSAKKVASLRTTEDWHNAIDVSVRTSGNIMSTKPEIWSFGDKKDNTTDGKTY